MSDAVKLDSHESHVILPTRTKVAYGMGGLAEIVILDATLNFLFPFYNVVLKVDAWVVGFALALPRLWDAITDPWMGQISDNTRSRWGRRRPYLMWGSIFFAVVVYLLWSPPHLVDAYLGAYLIVIAILFYTFYTIVLIPYISLGAEISIDYHERSRVQAWRAIFSRIGAIVAAFIWWFTQSDFFDNPREGFSFVAVCTALALLASFWIVSLGVREEADIQNQEKMRFLDGLKLVMTNRGFWILSIVALLFMTGIFMSFPLQTYLNIYYLYGGDQTASSTIITVALLVTQSSGLLFVPVVTRLSRKWGKKKTYLVGMVSFALAPLVTWFVFIPGMPYVQLLFNFLLGFGLAAWLVFPNSMIADICDLDELESGRRREGAYLGLYQFIFKVGFAATSLLQGFFLWMAGFDEKLQSQSADTITSLRIILLIAPVVMILIAAAVLTLFPLTEQQVHDVRQSLEQRRREKRAGAPMPVVETT